MEKDTAVSLIGQNALSIDLSYNADPLAKQYVSFASLDSKLGKIEPAVSGLYVIAETDVKGTYFIDSATGVLTINDGTESFDFEAIGNVDNYYTLDKWMLGAGASAEPAVVGTITNITSNTNLFAPTFKLIEYTATYVDTVGTGILPGPQTLPAGAINLDSTYNGQDSSGNHSTG